MTDPTKWVEKAEGWDADKHYAERSVNGFSYADWINFNDYIAWVNIQALEKFKTGHGFPSELPSMYAWIKELDIMIQGFEAYLAISNDEYDIRSKDALPDLMKTHREGMKLYAKRFCNLWD